MGLMTSIFKPSAGAVSESELRGPSAWLADMGGGGAATSSGVRVSPSNVITLSAVFAAARAIAEDTACLPLKAYRRLAGGGKGSTAGDPGHVRGSDGKSINLYALVHDSPNGEMDDLQFRTLLLWWAQLWGNAYAQIERSFDGYAVGMDPIHPHRVKVKTDDNGDRYYRVDRGPGKEPDVIRARDMIHIKGISDDGVIGIIIQQVGRDAFGTYLAAERYTASFFGNGATLAGIVSFDQSFSDKEMLAEYRRQFNETYVGAANSHKWMVAGNGAKATVLGTDPEKNQLVETLRFRIEDVARWFRVPPVVIGHNTNTPYTNVESLGHFYNKFGLKPWALRIEKEFTRKLVPEDEPWLFVEHVVDALMWADAAGRANFFNQGLRGGWMTPNEVRTIQNLNPYPGGERFRVEQNLALLDANGRPEQANKPTPPASGPPSPPPNKQQNAETIKARMMPVFVRAAERMVARESNAVGGKKNPTADWLDAFYKTHRDVVANEFEAPVAALAGLLDVGGKGVAERYADAHVGESRRRLAAGEDPSAWAVDRPAWIAKHLTDEVEND